MTNVATKTLDICGRVVYAVMAVPVHVGWRLLGRPIHMLLKDQMEQDRIHGQLLDAYRFGNVYALREILARAYYNTIVDAGIVGAGIVGTSNADADNGEGDRCDRFA